MSGITARELRRRLGVVCSAVETGTTLWARVLSRLMADVVAGVPVARGLQGRLTNAEVHDLFQNVGNGAVQPDSVYALLGSRGSTGCKQGSGQDDRLVQCLMRTRRSVYDVVRCLALLDPNAMQRVENARQASRMLEKARCSRIGRGHAWRFVLHAKCKMDNSIAKHRASWLTCLCREVGDGGLSVDGDVAKAVYAELGLEWRKDPSALLRSQPRQDSWLKRHSEHVEGALRIKERNQKQRLLRGLQFDHHFKSVWHESLLDTLHDGRAPAADSDSDEDELSVVCESDDESDEELDSRSEAMSEDSDASSDYYYGEEESGEGWGA